MDFLLQVFMAVLFAECFMGVVINMFIVAMQFNKWKALKSLETCNKILTCLGISRSLFLTTVLLDHCLHMYFHWTSGNIFSLAIWLSELAMHYINLWITTVLCVFYCLKIASYSYTLFILMKTRISRLVPHFIVASLLISVASILPYGFYVFWFHQQNAANFSLGDATLNITDFKQSYQDQVIILSLSSLPPFLIFCGAIYLLIRSIWRHTRQMRSSGTSFRSPNLEAHFVVVKSMILFLLCQVIYVGSVICSFSEILDINDPWNIWFSILICSPSFLHSSHIVYSNAKLKQTFTAMFYGLMRCR